MKNTLSTLDTATRNLIKSAQAKRLAHAVANFGWYLLVAISLVQFFEGRQLDAIYLLLLAASVAVLYL